MVTFEFAWAILSETYAATVCTAQDYILAVLSFVDS